MEAIRPNRVMFENVEGHISLGLSTVISDLEEDGYNATWGIFSAREVGAQHQRKRVFIMADSDGI
jgi:DNA (cytosine-5)-methyltransferase 1